MTEFDRPVGLSKIARLDDALALLPHHMDTPRARVMLLAIGLQESGFEYRDQLEKGGRNTRLGPALGFWQFERIGVMGVLAHAATRQLAEKVCIARKVQPIVRAVYEALATDDVLACAFARLYLFTDPKPIPEIGQIEPAWQCYVGVWRPGKPDRKRWTANYLAAAKTVTQ